MFVPDYLALLEKVETKEDLINIAEKMASGEIQYAFPYQLKLLLIEYSKTTLEIIAKEIHQRSSSVTSTGMS